jgi:Protein of unknown function (DUF565)
MQNTRLNTLLDRLTQRFTRWAQNPWRRISLIIISLLSGNFLASAIATTTGQTAELDITISATLVGIVEFISWLTYGNKADVNRAIFRQKPIWIAILNNLKLGLIYGLFVEAFKLGS